MVRETLRIPSVAVWLALKVPFSLTLLLQQTPLRSLVSLTLLLARSLAASCVVLHLLRCTPIVELPQSCASCGELAMTSSMAAAHQLCVSAKLNAPVYSQRPHLQQQQCRIHACASGCLLPP
jgi:hypothetical protein